MGSLTSRPKAPSVPKTVYVEVPARSSDTGDDASSQTTQDGAQDDAQDTSSEARKQNLLNRSRGRISTVLTGFRGVLSQPVDPSGRKTLLGE